LSFFFKCILPNTDLACLANCETSETAHHLFLGCATSDSVWHHVWIWLGIVFVASSTLSHHFVQFSYMAGITRSSHIFFKIIWLACVCVLWKERNNRIFKNMASDPSALIEKVKLNSFLWMKSKQVTFIYSFHEWWKHPLLCMCVHL